MNMTLSNTGGLLNYKQTAVLLHLDHYNFRQQWEKTESVPQPAARDAEGNPLWTTDQVREMRAVVPRGSANRKVNWADSEYLTAKMCGELHEQPIKLRSFFANLARKRSREAKGFVVDGGVPEPDRKILGHPVWAPETLRDYLASRPGPGNHKTKAEGRNGYTGGRVPGTKIRRNRSDLVTTE
jgi:hypothetical protein